MIEMIIKVSLISLFIPIFFIALIGSWVLAIDLAATMLGIR